MHVRRFRSSDASALASIFHASVREGGLRDYSPEQVRAWSPSLPGPKAYHDRAEQSMVFVAVDEADCPIGYADVRSGGYIDHLYCRPDRISTGVGSALCAAVEAAAASAGITLLTVDASEGARALFERRGFRVEARRDFTINGVAIHNYRMARPAPAPYRVEVAREGAEAIARAVLDTLPEWFGRPDALDAYVAATGRLGTLVAYSPDGTPAGFLSLEAKTAVAVEIHVIGVMREHRGRGCGRKLIDAAVEASRAEGARWLTVKTLAESVPDPDYAETRLFYEASGFEPVEVFADFWREGTHTLLMVRAIR